MNLSEAVLKKVGEIHQEQTRENPLMGDHYAYFEMKIAELLLQIEELKAKSNVA